MSSSRPPPLSYSEIIARQSAIIAEQDNNYLGHQRITSNSRLTFRRVDYASVSNIVSQHQQQTSAIINRNTANNNNTIQDASRGKTHTAFSFARQDSYAPRTERVSMPFLASIQHENGAVPILSPETTKNKYTELNKGQLPYSAVAKGISKAVTTAAPVVPKQITSVINGTHAETKQSWQGDMLFGREPPSAPKKALKKPSHYWPPTPPGTCNNTTCNNRCNHVCDMLCRKECDENKPVNGLIEALEKHLQTKQDESNLPANITQTPSSSRSKNVGSNQDSADNLNLLRAAVANAAKEGFQKHSTRQKHNSSRLSSETHPQSHHTNGLPSSRETKPPALTGLPRADRQPIPFNRENKHTTNWLQVPASPENTARVTNLWQPNQDRLLVNMRPTQHQPPRNYSPAYFPRPAIGGHQRDATHDEYRLLISLRGGGEDSSSESTTIPMECSEVSDGSEVPEGELSDFYSNEEARGFDQDLQMGIRLVQFSSPEIDEPSACNGVVPGCFSACDLVVPKSRDVRQYSCAEPDLRTASWSSSHSWIGDEEKEKGRWAKIQARLRFAGMDRSPFVPSSFAEYLEFKITMMEREVAKKKTELETMESEWELLREYIAMGGDVGDVVSSSRDEDGLTACNEATSEPSEDLWPSVRQLKIWGGLPPKESLTRL